MHQYRLLHREPCYEGEIKVRIVFPIFLHLCAYSFLRPLDVDDTIVAIIREMSRIPGAIKTWKTPVIELLNDNRLFNSNPDVAEKWKPIVRALYDSDKTAFPELLSTIFFLVFLHALISLFPLSQSCHRSFRQHFHE